MDPETVPAGPARSSNFQDGAHGGDVMGSVGMHQATSIQQGVSPQFHPGSVLALPNTIQTGNAESKGTFSLADPYNSSMKDMVTQKAAGGNGAMNV